MDKSKYIEFSLYQKNALLSKDGALIVKTGASTGRSTKERFVVKHPDLEDQIDWGPINQGISAEFSAAFFSSLKNKIQQKEYHKTRGYAGCFSVEVISTSPWHMVFAQNMFRKNYIEDLKNIIPADLPIEIWHDPNGKVSELNLKFDFPFEKAIIIDFKQRQIGIIGTAYAGEIKKSAFALCNFLLPQFGVFPMHASANCLEDGAQTSVLFGLSGTGKTTLSADPHRFLIGDDEIIWSPNGISNLEGGCYAKLINLKEQHEPDIYHAANRFGSILENVSYNECTREINFADNSITENTRGSYSLDVLSHVYDQTRQARPPKSIVFLVADAFGALPVMAKLNFWQAQYHFVSGYTAKLAGTEIGVTEPQATFSSCFGAPFMPRPAKVYAQMLSEMAQKHEVSIWLLNTGWSKGGYKQGGERFPIPVSRRLLQAIQNGELDHVAMKKHEVFGFEVPEKVLGVDPQWLSFPDASRSVPLAQRFIANAESKKSSFSPQMIDLGGPRLFN